MACHATVQVVSVHRSRGAAAIRPWARATVDQLQELVASSPLIAPLVNASAPSGYVWPAGTRDSRACVTNSAGEGHAGRSAASVAVADSMAPHASTRPTARTAPA